MFVQYVGIQVENMSPPLVKIVPECGHPHQVQNAYMNCFPMETISNHARFILHTHNSWPLVVTR